MSQEPMEISRVEQLIIEGRQYLQDGNLPAAIARFRIATKEDPRLSLAWNDLGVALYASKQYDRAKQAFSTALNMTPEYIDAALNYAALCRKMGRPMDCAPRLREACRHNPGEPELLAAIRRLGLNQTRPVALTITSSSDGSRDSIENCIRESGYQLHRADPRIAACCSTTVRLTEKSWERYFGLVRPTLLIIDTQIEGTALPLLAARKLGVQTAIIGGKQASLPPSNNPMFLQELQNILENADENMQGKSRISPPLSIIVSASRGPKDCTNLLDHLSLQDLESGLFEAIIVDDGSEIPIVDHIDTADYPFQIKLIRQNSSGRAAACNKAIASARGRWLLFMDETALPMASNLRGHLVAQITATRESVVMGPTYTRPDLVNCSFRRLVESQPIIYGHNQMVHKKSYAGSTFPRSNVSVARKSILKIGGFDEAMPEGIEESELGYRLDHNQGIGVKYSRDLRCETVKTYDISDFLSRQNTQGWSCHYMWRKHNDTSFIHGDPDRPPHDMFFLALRLEVEQNEERMQQITEKLQNVTALEQRVGESHGEDIVQVLTHRLGIHEFSRGMIIAESGFQIDTIRERGRLVSQTTPIVIRDNGSKSEIQSTIDSLASVAADVHIILPGSDTGLQFPESMTHTVSSIAEAVQDLEGDAIGICDAGTIFAEGWRENLLPQLQSWPDVGIVSPNTNYRPAPDTDDVPTESLHIYRRNLNNNVLFIHRQLLEHLDMIEGNTDIEIGSETFYKQTRLAGFLLRHALGCIFSQQAEQKETALTGTGTGG